MVALVALHVFEVLDEQPLETRLAPTFPRGGELTSECIVFGRSLIEQLTDRIPLHEVKARDPDARRVVPLQQFRHPLHHHRRLLHVAPVTISSIGVRQSQSRRLGVIAFYNFRRAARQRL